MFNIKEYYTEVHSGNPVSDKEIIAFINSFEKVIIWGGSYLGNAIGKYLINRGISINYYWDLRYKELVEIHGVEVIQPFTKNTNENTLIILCIANNVLITKLLMTLKTNNYNHVLRGDFLYEGTICPFNKETGIKAKQCSGTMECRQIYCHRLGNIVKGLSGKSDPLHLTSVTLVINSKCSLACKYCTSYINEYPSAKRINIPLERISKDIDVFFDTVDSVGTITVMGGEPFMHPHLSEIIEKLCEKKNFGLVSIASSGTYRIKENQLKGLYDDRVNVSFSNYSGSITEKQKKLFYKNIDFLKDKKICHTVGLFSPEWIIPSTLYRKTCTIDEMITRKSRCINWHQIKNGKVHPCDFATALYSLEIADYITDYVDLTKDICREQLRNLLKLYINRPYYQSCAHHMIEAEDGTGNGMTAKAAEQGCLDFNKPLMDQIIKGDQK